MDPLMPLCLWHFILSSFWTWPLCDHCVCTPDMKWPDPIVSPQSFIGTLGLLEKDKQKTQGQNPSLFSLIQWNVKRGGEIFSKSERLMACGEWRGKMWEIAQVIRTFFSPFFGRIILGEENTNAWWLLQIKDGDGQETEWDVESAQVWIMDGRWQPLGNN